VSINTGYARRGLPTPHFPHFHLHIWSPTFLVTNQKKGEVRVHANESSMTATRNVLCATRYALPSTRNVQGSPHCNSMGATCGTNWFHRTKTGSASKLLCTALSRAYGQGEDSLEVNSQLGRSRAVCSHYRVIVMQPRGPSYFKSIMVWLM